MTPMTNARKAEVYRRAHDRLEVGWTQGDLDDGLGNVCLVGAIENVAASRREVDEVQLDVAQTLLSESLYARIFSHAAEKQLSWARKIGDYPLNSDGGIAFVERWNDSKFRRKKRVLKLLAARRDHFTALAKDDRIAELEHKIARLTERYAELQAHVERLNEEIVMLRDEVRFFRGVRLGYAQREMASIAADALSVDARVYDLEAELRNLL